MRIGELGERVGVSPKTIRYYEDVGLLAPPARAASGYRDYDRDAVGRLQFIRAAKSIGLTLGEVREVLSFRDRGEIPCAHVSALIDRHAADLAGRIESLQAMKHDLDQLARRARHAPAKDAAYCHLIETHTVSRRTPAPDDTAPNERAVQSRI